MTRSPEEIEAEIERTRLDVDRTVEALKEKMSPQQLMHDMMDAVRNRGSDAVAFAGDQVRKHPAPAAILVAGLGVLAWRASRGSKSHHASVDDRLWNNVEPRRGTGASMYQSNGGNAYSRSGLHSDQSGIGRAFQRAMDNDPLIVGAIAVVIGAAIGAALPTTKAENCYLGRVRNDAVAKMRGMASERIEDVK
jgi:hypothetical protein